MSISVEQPVGGRDARPVRFGPYVLIERIGQGGMANVYKAVLAGPNGFEKTVVVKAMLPALADNREFVDLFTAEAKTTAQLSHPGIVQVHDYGVYLGIPFLVMEHLDGINLAQLMQSLGAAERRLPLGIALVIATEICHALGFAHTWRDRQGVRRQIIHSDVSPSNVMVCRDGSVKLLDFGVARIVDEFDFDVSVTLKGKFAYMAPEQVNRQPFDRRVDVFAAGIVLHEMLTGRRLFAAQTELDTLRRVDAAEVTPPSEHNPEVPLDLDLVVLKALARDPGERFDDGEAMAAALQQVGRVGGGRRRVAEFVQRLFPECWQVTCDVCGKGVVPGLVCAECGTEAPRPEAPSACEGTVPIDRPPVLHVEPFAREESYPKGEAFPQANPLPEALRPVMSSRPRSITQIVVGKVKIRPVRKRGRARRALLSVGMIGALFAVGAGVGQLRRWAAEHPRQAPAPVAEATVRPVELPSPEAPEPARAEVAPAPESPLFEPDVIESGAGLLANAAGVAPVLPEKKLDFLAPQPDPAPPIAVAALAPKSAVPTPEAAAAPPAARPQPKAARPAAKTQAARNRAVRRQPAARVVQRAQPHFASPASIPAGTPPAPSVAPHAPAPVDALRVKDGRLLDPFGGGESPRPSPSPIGEWKGDK